MEISTYVVNSSKKGRSSIDSSNKLRDSLPYTLFFESGRQALLVIDLAVNGILIYMGIVKHVNIEFKLVLWQNYIKFCSYS